MPDVDATLGARDFKFVVELVYQHSRIVIGPHKRSMLQGRLAKRSRALGLASLHDYVTLLGTAAGQAELSEMMNAVTTNVTAFFREMHHFRHLANVVLPELCRDSASSGRLRIWSAACSTGQEPYSIAMTVHAALHGRATLDARILATDIDSNVVRRAAEGPMQGPFDAVFCRNVVIYFDKATQAKLFDSIADLLSPSGWLYIGHSESLFNVTNRFRLVGKTTYQRCA
jgi:chemotaxis protein methyltransferase CheR